MRIVILAVAVGFGALASSAVAQISCATVVNESGQVLSPNPATDSYFGDGVAFDGNWLAVGATGQASVFIYEMAAGEWHYRQTLAVPDFGGPLALRGSVLAAGAFNADSERGAVYVFECDAANSWQQVGRLQPADLSPGSPGSVFGFSVALDGVRLVVGARFDAGWRGSAYVFDRQSDGQWTQVAKLDPGVSTWREFGFRCDVVGNTIAVSDQYCGGCGGTENGNVYVFDQQPSGQWNLTQTLSEADAGAGAAYGGRIAMDGGVLCVSAPAETVNGLSRAGRAYIYERNASGTWGKTYTATYPDTAAASTRFGDGLACYGSTVLAAATTPEGQDIVYVLQKTLGSWTCGGRLDASNDLPGSGLGTFLNNDISLRGSGAWIGASLNDSNRGAVYFFSVGCQLPALESPPASVEVTPCQPAAFSVTASSSSDLTYHWRRNGTNLNDNPRVSGTATPTLTIRPAGYFLGGTYDVVVTNSCGSVASQSAQLTLRDPADFDGDGDVGTDSDIAAFFACLGGSCCPTCLDVDINGDGDIGTDADIESFFRALAGGPC